MALTKVKILGISGSPRHGNTEILVKECLDGARSVSGVETEFLSIAGLRLAGGCKALYRCWRTPSVEHPCLCYREEKDDMNLILRALMAADGIVVGIPVYWGGIPAQFKMVIDRSMSIEMGFRLRNKVGAVLAVAAERNGGQESAIADVQRWFYIHDMIVCGVGPERPATSVGVHWGAAACQGFPYPVHSDEPGEKEAVRQDVIGLGAARSVGRRVAELAKIVQTGLSNLDDRDLAWPKGAVGSEVFDRAARSG